MAPVDPEYRRWLRHSLWKYGEEIISRDEAPPDEGWNDLDTGEKCHVPADTSAIVTTAGRGRVQLNLLVDDGSQLTLVPGMSARLVRMDEE